MPVFDSNVFDVGIFDVSYATPLLRNVVVEEEFSKASAGQDIPIKVHIQSVDTTYGRRFDLTPEDGVSIEVHNPDGSIKLPFTRMANLVSGKYIYVYQTNIGDQEGYYTVRIKAVNGDKVMLSRLLGIFELMTLDSLQILDTIVFDPSAFDTVLT